MHKDAQIRWDDVAYVLAVVDHGSVAAAARALGVNHATVLRRLGEFETRTGVQMFNRTTRGYQISPDRRAVVEAMRHASEALGAVGQLVERARPRLEDGLRLTTTDTIAQYILPPLIPRLIDATGSPIEVTVDNAHIDLSRMQSQLTVRPALTLPSELEGLQAGVVRFGVYAAKGVEKDAWIGLTGPLARTNAAEFSRDVALNPMAHADSFLAAAAMAATGIGHVVLPTYVGEQWSNLSCVDQPEDLGPVPVWVGAHVDFAGIQRIKRARSHLAKALSRHPALAEQKKRAAE